LRTHAVKEFFDWCDDPRAETSGYEAATLTRRRARLSSRRAHGAAYATYIGCWRKHARVPKGRRSIARFEDDRIDPKLLFPVRHAVAL
jgi:hypothetical protein